MRSVASSVRDRGTARRAVPPLARFVAAFGAAPLFATATAQQFQPFQFAPGQLIPQVMPPGSVGLPLCGDIDGDGRNDLVIVSAAGLSVDYAIGDGSYVVTLQPNVLPVTQTAAARLCDFDRDGALDLLAIEGAQPSRLQVFRNQGGTLPLAQSVALGANVSALDPLRVADVDGDGDLDVLVVSTAGALLVRNAGGAFQAPTLAVAGAAQAVDLLDADGDGDLDVVLGEPSSIRLFANDGSGAFTSASTLCSAPALNVTGFGVLDLDGDGDLDLVAAMVGVFRNEGNLAFTDVTAVSLPHAYDAAAFSVVRCADFDGDGRADVLLPGACALRGGPIGVLLHGNGDGTFADVSSRLPPGVVSNQVELGDVDDDGDSDMLFLGDIATLPYGFVLANHQRQCVLATPLQLGQPARFDISSGPGFGVVGTAWLAAATGAVSHPFALPGFAGQVLIDPTDPLSVAVVPTSAAGSASAFVAVPNASWLLGLGVWFEVALLPNPGAAIAPSLTNAVTGSIGP